MIAGTTVVTWASKIALKARAKPEETAARSGLLSAISSRMRS